MFGLHIIGSLSLNGLPDPCKGLALGDAHRMHTIVLASGL